MNYCRETVATCDLMQELSFEARTTASRVSPSETTTSASSRRSMANHKRTYFLRERESIKMKRGRYCDGHRNG